MKIGSITKTYGSRTVLQMPAVDLTPGKVHVVLGANGSGKSTWAKIITGILPSDEKRPALESGYRAGYLPQKPYVFRMSLERNLRTAAADPKREARLMELLHLETLRKAGAHKLSGGETARMALARILMKDFDLLVLDEPSAAMDMESAKLAEEAVDEYRKTTGAAVLLITHSISQAARTGETLFFLQEGRLAESGECGRCLASPATRMLADFLAFYGG